MAMAAVTALAGVALINWLPESLLQVVIGGASLAWPGAAWLLFSRIAVRVARAA
jgi:hypothetical protein